MLQRFAYRQLMYSIAIKAGVDRGGGWAGTSWSENLRWRQAGACVARCDHTPPLSFFPTRCTSTKKSSEARRLSRPLSRPSQPDWEWASTR